MTKRFLEGRDDWFTDILNRLRSWDWLETCPTKQAWIFHKHGPYSTWICHIYWHTNVVCFFKQINEPDRKYEYYCETCKKVTNWTISGPHRRVEKHKCVSCGQVVPFVLRLKEKE